MGIIWHMDALWFVKYQMKPPKLSIGRACDGLKMTQPALYLLC